MGWGRIFLWVIRFIIMSNKERMTNLHAIKVHANKEISKKNYVLNVNNVKRRITASFVFLT